MRTNLFKKLTFALLAFWAAATVGNAYAKQYDLVTSIDQLVSGKEYIIASFGDENEWYTFATTTVGTYISEKSLSVTQVSAPTLFNSVADIQPVILTKYNTSDWAIWLTSEEKYLAGSGNAASNIVSLKENAADGYWTISFVTSGDSNYAHIKCNGTGMNHSRFVLKFNHKSTRFACYQDNGYTANTSQRCWLYMEHVDAPPPPTPTVTSGTNIKNFTMKEGETLAETVILKASNVTKDLNVSIIQGGESAAMTVTTTGTATNGKVSNPSELTIGTDTTFSVSIANNGALSEGTYHDTLVIEQDGIRAGEVVLNLTVSAANAPAISITQPTKDQSITADSFNTIYILENLKVDGTVRAQLSGAGKYDSVQITSGTGEANIWIRNLASGDYTLEAMLVETSDPSNVLATATSVDFSVDLPDIVEGTDYEVLVSGGTYREETKSYKDSVRVKIAALENIEIAEVRYTTDGTTPNAASSLLAAEGVKLTAAGSHTLKYRVVIAHHDTLYGDTTVSVHYLYTNKVTANPVPGVYFSAQNVTLSCATPGAVIHYTTDGTIPTEMSNTYSTQIEISATTTLKALAWADGYNASTDSIVTGTYNIVDITPASLPVNMTSGKSALTPATGWYESGLGSDYASPCQLRFDNSGDYIILAFSDSPETLSFKIKNNNVTLGLFSVDTSMDGSTWGTLKDYTAAGSDNFPTNTNTHDIVFNLSLTTRFVKWVYTTKSSGNIGLGNISVTKLTCVNPTALTSSSITSAEATINWTSTADTVKYRYGTAKPLSDEWTKAETGESSATQTSLTPGTKYYYEVQNYCSNGLTSEAVIDSFTTLEASTPVITLSAESVAFDTIVTRSQTKSITATAANLGEAATVTLKDGSAGFAVLPATATDNNETRIDITYTATGTAEQIDTVVISGGSITKEVALTGTPRNPSVNANSYTVRFSTPSGIPQGKKVIITGSNLLGDISLALKDGSNYTLSKATVTEGDALREGGDTVTVTFKANAATASDTIVVTGSNATAKKIALSGTSYVSENILLVENFDYADSDTLSRSATNNIVDGRSGWETNSGGLTAPVKVAVPGLTLDGYIGSDIGGLANLTANGQDIYKSFVQPVDNGTVYAAALVKILDNHSEAEGYFMGLYSGSYIARVYVNAAGTELSISNDNSSGTPVAVEKGETYMVVIEQNVDDGTSKLYVMDSFFTEKPASALEAATTASVASGVTRLALRQYDPDQKIQVDGIRVARTWEGAVKSIDPAVFTVRPSCNNLASTSADVSFTLDENAKVYYVVKTGSQAGLTAENIVSDITKDSVNAVANTSVTIPLTGLTAETPYYVYLTAQNIGGYSAVDSALFTTLSATAPVITVAPTSLDFDTVITRSKSKDITVTTANLGGTAAVALKDGTVGFAVSPSVANDNDVTVVTVTYTAGSSTVQDTVVVTGGGETKHVALTGTPVYPSISVNVSSLQFNAVSGTPAKEKIVVSGTNLLGDITLAKGNASYTLDKVTVSAADAMRAGGDTVTVTYAADVAALDTVVITASYATTVKIPVSGTVRNRYENMVENPGFEIWEDEQAPASWMTNIDGTFTQFVKKTDDVHGGLNAAYVSATATRNLITIVNGVEAGKHYTISFWYKIDSIGGNGIRIWSVFRNGTANITSTGDPNLSVLQPSEYQKTAGEWIKFEISDYVAPENADNFRFEVRTYNGAKARFDDFFFGEVNPSAPQIALSTSSLAYNNVALGTSQEKKVTVSTVNVSDSLVLSITGNNAEYFSAPPKTGYGNDTFYVVYAPLAEGNHTATLTVSNGSMEKYIALSGNGVDMSVITPISSIVTGESPSPYNGQTVNITGIVVAKTEADNFFVQEAAGATHGLYIYRNGANVAVGDSVVLTGSISEYHGLTELTLSSASDVTVVANGKDIFTPVEISDLSQLNKTLHSVLVTITDTLYYGSAAENNRYVVNNGTENITVMADIYNSTSLAGEGKIIVSITGMATYYDANQIVPRSEDDLTVVSVSVGAEVVGKAAKAVLYPNPANGVFTIETLSEMRYEVMNMQGVTVEKGAVNGNKKVAVRTAGIYLVRLTDTNGKTSTQRVIIK